MTPAASRVGKGSSDEAVEDWEELGEGTGGSMDCVSMSSGEMIAAGSRGVGETTAVGASVVAMAAEVAERKRAHALNEHRKKTCTIG